METAEDKHYSSADTDSREQKADNDWEKAENLRGRIVMLDSVMMLAGWGHYSSPYDYRWLGFLCKFDQESFRTATGVGRDEYIRKYWNKEQPLNRTYTKERLTAVEGVLDNLERWLQERIDYWESLGRDGEGNLQQCEIALHGDPKEDGWQGVREWRQAIVAETTQLPE